MTKAEKSRYATNRITHGDAVHASPRDKAIVYCFNLLQNALTVVVVVVFDILPLGLAVGLACWRIPVPAVCND